MLKSKIFIATTGRALVRASYRMNDKWDVEFPLDGKKISCLASDPVNQSVIYAGSDNGGIFFSDDYGKTWYERGLLNHSIKALAVNQLDSNIIYAGTKSARMFISEDSAKSWNELEGFRRIPNRWWWFSPAQPPDIRPYVMAITCSPSDKDLLLAGIEFGAVVRSTDGGKSWSRHRSGALRDCHSLKFHSTNDNFVYQAGGTGGGAAISRDKGNAFTRLKKGLAKHYGIVCVADPLNPELYYICVAPSPFKAYGTKQEAYLYRSSEKNGWKAIGWKPHPLPVTATALVTLADAPGHLFAGLSNGDVWHTNDAGIYWQKLPFNLKKIWFSLIILTRKLT